MEYASVSGIKNKRIHFSFNYYGLRLLVRGKHESFSQKIDPILDELENGRYGLKNIKYLSKKTRFTTCDLDFSADNGNKKKFTKDMERLVLDICKVIQEFEPVEKEKAVTLYLANSGDAHKGVKILKIKGDMVYE